MGEKLIEVRGLDKRQVVDQVTEIVGRPFVDGAWEIDDVSIGLDYEPASILLIIAGVQPSIIATSVFTRLASNRKVQVELVNDDCTIEASVS